MHDPMTVVFGIPTRLKPWFTIWHVDPCRDHTDDSCGLFMRARHGDSKVLENIVKRFECDWDSTFTSEGGHVYSSGFFFPNGQPAMSVHAIGMNLFFLAALEAIGGRDKAMKFVQNHLAEIFLFAENPFDSLHDSITLKFQTACNEEHTQKAREERIRSMASCIYGWILREQRPWYRHPRWHIWHWKIQWHFGQKLYRWLFARCSACGGRFKKWGECPMSDWHGTKLWHSGCDSQKLPATKQ